MDTIDPANSEAESTWGKTGKEKITVTAGTRMGEFETRYMEGGDAGFAFDLSINRETPLVIEIQEVHPRRGDDIRYDVRINDTRVYARSYGVNSAGRNHYFVKVTDEDVLDEESLSIEFVNRRSGRVHIGNVWAYTDFEDRLDEESIGYDPMELSVLRQLPWTDFDAALEMLGEIKTKIPSDDRMCPSFGVQIDYAQMMDSEVERRIDYVLDLSAKADLPAIIQFDTWWGGTPNGSDGEGNYWWDLPYQQITYVPDEGYGLSIPNMWADTPWLTMNSERLNEFRRRRLRSHMRYLRQSYFERLASDGPSPEITGLVMDSEPRYWASGMPGTPSNQSADFNPETIADAEAEGIDLDPTEGLDYEERVWLHRNVAEYNDGLASAMATGLGTNPVLPDGTNGPKRQLRRLIFGQGFSGAPFPFDDDFHSFWETSIVPDASVGLEPGQKTENYRRIMEYMVGWGLAANTNMEVGLPVVFPIVNESFANGLDHVFLYNLPSEQYSTLAERVVKRSSEENRQPKTYQYTLEHVNFLDDYEQFVYRSENIGSASDQHRPLVPEDPSKTARLGLRFDLREESCNEIVLDYRARLSGRGEPRLTVSAGPSKERCTPVDELRSPELEERSVPVSNGSNNESELFVQFEFTAGDGYEGYVDGALEELRLVVTPDDDSGHTHEDIRFTEEETRRQFRWVTERREARQALDALSNSVETNTGAYDHASELFEEGKYVSSRTAASEALSRTLPARFVITDNKRLGDRPVQITTDGSPVTAVLESIDTDDNSLQNVFIGFESHAAEQSIEIKLLDVKEGAAFALNRRQAGVEISRIDERVEEQQQVSEDTVSFCVTISPEERDVPKELTGDVRGVIEDGLLVRPDSASAESFDHAGQVTVYLTDDTVVRRGPSSGSLEEASLPELAEGDYVVATVTDWEAGNREKRSGVTVERVDAQYGEARFEIASIQMRTQNTKASITSPNGSEYVLDSLTSLDLSDQNGDFRSIPIGDLSLSPGDAVRVQYTPITNRSISIQQIERQS